MDDKHSQFSSVPPYEQHSGAAPSPMATGHAPASSPPPGQQSYGQPQPYGAPPLHTGDSYGAPPPAHSPPAQNPYGAPPPQQYQGQFTQNPIQAAPTGQQQGVTSPVSEKHEYYSQGQQQQQGLPQYQQQPGIVQQGTGMQGVPQGGVVMPPTPLPSLQSTPAWVQCPACHQIAMTAVEFHSGNTTHAWAAVFFCCAFLCCVPYFIKQFKDAEHKCSKCGTLLAVHHASGSTRVLAHS